MSGFLGFVLGVAVTLGLVVVVVRLRRWPKPAGDFPPPGGGASL